MRTFFGSPREYGLLGAKRAMRILHTSDWHLGKTLAGRSRADEHRAFADEVVALGREVDLVVVSGDVFDTWNPPIEAEELFFDTLARLGDGGRRAVVVIAGNHDSPDRICAPSPLSGSHGVYLLGRPGEQVAACSGRGSTRLLGSAPSVLDLELPAGRAVIGAVPYPSEARLGAAMSEDLDERAMRAGYTECLGALFGRLAAAFRPDAVNLLTSHLLVTGGAESESERALVGGACQVPSSVFPAAAQYVALGHLHRAQEVPGPTAIRYAGAPLAFRMSEADYPRSHCVVTVAPGGRAGVELIPVAAGRRLERWSANSVDEVARRVDSGEGKGAFVELELHVETTLSHASLARLYRLPVDLVRVRPVLPGVAVGAEPEGARHQLPLAELFRAFYRKTRSTEPDGGLVDLFLELAGAGATPPPSS